MRLLAAAVVALAGSACGGDGPTPPGGGVASLSLVPNSDIRLYAVGETAQITATPKDESGNTVSAPIEWTSSNPAVASVAGTGATTATITATGLGTARIKAAVSATIFQEINVVVQQPQFNANANSACSNPDMRSYKIETQTEHLLIVSDLGNPPGGFTSQDYASIAATFESLVWPTVTANFGLPADIDANGKVIAFYTRAVNELTPANSQSVVGGFFFGRDLFPKTPNSRFQGCAGSNEAEMFYMLVPDPNGVVNGNVRSVQSVRNLTVGVLGHEFQHLINSSRRLYINQAAMWPETAYMEEGLSHIAEELIFYEASGLAPKTNLTAPTIIDGGQRQAAFNSYMASNAGRLSSYMRAPSDNAPYQKDDDLATRGAIWSFLRYLSDRGTPGTPLTESSCTTNPLTVGQQCAVEGPAAASFTVPAGSTPGEFTIIAFAKDLPVVTGTSPAQAGSITTDASATNTITVTGPPNPWVGNGGAQLSTFAAASIGAAAAVLAQDNVFHAKLRRIERRDLPGRVDGARAAYALRHRASARMYSAGQTTPAMSHFAVEPVWAQLVNASDTGMPNLRGRFGQDISGAAQDWAVANYVDDTGLPGIPAQHTHPSWNFRSVLPPLSSNSGVYPLQVHVLTSPRQVVMADGGAAYYRFGLLPGATSTVSFTVSGGAPPANLKLVVVRTK